MDLKEKQKKCLIYAAGMNYVIYLFMRLFFYATYECALDEMMQAAVCGVSGTRTAYILYSNVLIGWMLKGLASVLPFVNWYFAYLYVSVFAALFLMSYIIMKRAYNRIGITTAVVLACFAGYECYVLPGCMKTACMLGTAALMVFADYRETARRRDKRREMLAGFLAVFGSMVHFSALLITMLAGLISIGCYYAIRHWNQISAWIRKERGIDRKACRQMGSMLGSVLGCTLAAIVVFFIVDDFSYRFSGQEAAADYRAVVVRLYGYGMADYEESMTEEYGIDSAKYSAVRNGSFAVEGEQTWKKLKEIVKDWTGISGEAFNDYFKTVPIALFKYGIFYLLIVMLFMLFYSPVKEKKMLIWTQIGLLLIFFYAAYLFHAWQNRWMVFVLILPLVLPLFLSLRGAPETEYQYLWVYLAVLSIILYSKFSSGMVSSVSEEDMTAKFANVNAGQVNLVDLNAYFKTFSAQQAYMPDLLVSQSIRVSNGAYDLMDGFDGKVVSQMPGENEAYGWLYNPRELGVENLLLQ